jgi:hypothetical protein
VERGIEIPENLDELKLEEDKSGEPKSRLEEPKPAQRALESHEPASLPQTEDSSEGQTESGAGNTSLQQGKDSTFAQPEDSSAAQPES